MSAEGGEEGQTHQDLLQPKAPHTDCWRRQVRPFLPMPLMWAPLACGSCRLVRVTLTWQRLLPNIATHVAECWYPRLLAWASHTRQLVNIDTNSMQGLCHLLEAVPKPAQGQQTSR